MVVDDFWAAASSSYAPALRFYRCFLDLFSPTFADNMERIPEPNCNSGSLARQQRRESGVFFCFFFPNLNQRFLNFIDTSARTSRSRRATCSTEQPSVRSSFLCITCDKATRSAEAEAQPSGCWSGRLQPLASRAHSQRLGLKATC